MIKITLVTAAGGEELQRSINLNGWNELAVLFIVQLWQVEINSKACYNVCKAGDENPIT